MIRKLIFPYLCFAILTALSKTAFAQTDSIPSLDLKRLSLEELMDIEVTSVSKRPEKLTEVASAIQVITQKDIHNSGAKTLPEALRLASNLQVAQVNASQWAISARGFNNVLANKLLVLIDGRTVYTPLYAGVFWDIQNLVLEDVDHIEVISGPGGTLWGANAVNGVINIITKNSKDTQGILAEALHGNTVQGIGSLRYGAQITEALSYKVYGTGFKLDNTINSKTGLEANDYWSMLQGGVRIDWAPSEKNLLTLHQDVYKAEPNPNGGVRIAEAKGDNIIIRWNHKATEKYDYQIQVYYDHAERLYPTFLLERLKTYDIDWDNRLQIGKRQLLSFGSNLRIMDHKVANIPLTQFVPDEKRLYLYSVFVQDQLSLLNDRLKLTLGTKIEHNSYTGFEIQPNSRLSFTAAKNHMLWAAISRAVKTPSRLDRDIRAYANPATLLLSGSDNFRSETLLAYELGWRLQPMENISLSVSSFYNFYNYIRSAEPPVAPAKLPLITLGNGVKGETYGVELSGTYQLSSWWNLRGGYTLLRKELMVKPGSQDQNKASAESNDPQHQILVQSNLKLPAGFEFGSTFRYIDKLPKPYLPDYAGLDLRLGWRLKMVEFNLVGQNLLDKHHPEFIPSSPSARQIQRSVYGKITLRY